MQRFEAIKGWVFDLDNTLYPASQNLFAQIDKRMTAFIGEALEVEREEAYRLQKQFLGEYGTTLAGLMNKHGMPPGPFLDFVHDIDVSVLDPDPHLDEALAALPGKKFIFTNGTVGHAERVMGRLGVAHHFEDIFDIVAGDYLPKPNPEIYPAMLERFQLAPQSTAFFEDMARNLTPAHALGMTTVLVADSGEDTLEAMNMPAEYRDIEEDHIHHKTDNLAAFLKQLAAIF
ncbi:MAG: pyrimidine 5'-nucleotidase [PS1 clade bacterium]|jgi:putative hydrolase of the HAD superfamily|uniref:Pyrimidine 5'-nucleotidase n=1 Tax=PS1 clade bacterium TaxID=2175152 RepID=A0A937HFQ0_9PROT|nr:pyrimidine 5'-nucleotidase [PS1 clade bacterium]